jgi:serine/threonine-protein kinase
MPAKPRINERYELQGIIGRGGMGVVYRGYDTVVRREVALKTIRDLPSPKVFELFRKECGVMASMSHPNIVEIFDVGEFEENGSVKPYLVMPLLPGATLDHLIHNSSQRLTVDRAIDIILQTCRGLQAAHERGLVHRDLKPSNIFVMPDHSVKVIDFGLAQMADVRTSLSLKGGTLPYMAPEQLEMKPATPLSDIFSLGVVFYEMLTRRRPFDSPEAATDQDVIDAILHRSPVLVTDLNPEVSQIVSRVVHKAIAKQPWNRFKSAGELAETLQKALRKEPIAFFDDSAIEPRIQRALKAFEKENYQFAGEILSELEAEGHLHPAIPALRRQLDQAVHQKQIAHLLESARTCFQEEEYLLALQKLQEVLQMDKDNSSAMALKASVENRLSEQKLEEWLRLARQHLEHNEFTLAREALQNLLQLRPQEPGATQLLAEVGRREHQYLQARQEKHQLYEAALESWKRGEMSAALSKMERLIELDRQVPDASSPDRGISYQNFYNEIRSECDAARGAYQEARKHLLDGAFNATLEICQRYLAKYPGHALFQALKFDVEERQRQELSSRIAEINRCVEAEPDLDRRVDILKEALEQYPGEPHFERALRLMRDRRDLVASISSRARSYEERGQFNEALGQWETLQAIHQQYPGLQVEIERVIKRRDQQARAEAKARWANQIDRQLESGEYGRALELIRSAAREFPDGPELATLETLALQGQARVLESRQLLAKGQDLCTTGQVAEGLAELCKAHELDPRNVEIRAAYVNALLEEARTQLDRNWAAADALIVQALTIDPAHPLAKSLQTLVLDRKYDEFVSRYVAEARQMQAGGDEKDALAHIEEGLAVYPQDQRLLQLKATLRRSLSAAVAEAALVAAAPQPLEALRPEARSEDSARELLPEGDVAATLRAADLDELRSFLNELPTADSGLINKRLARTEAIGTRHPDDEEVRGMVTEIKTRLTETMLSKPPLPQEPAPKREQAENLWARLRMWLNRLRTAELLAKLDHKRRWIMALLGAAPILLAAAAAYFTWPVEIHIRAQPAGAAIRINGRVRGLSDVRLKLREGAYDIRVSLEGYVAETRTLYVRRREPQLMDLALKRVIGASDPEPPQSLQISSDQPGQVILDEQPPIELQEGQFSLPALPWGSRKIKIVSAKREVEFSLQTAPKTVASLSEPLKPGDPLIIIVAASQKQARVYSNAANAQISLNEEKKGELQSGMMDLPGLPEGTYKLTLQTGQEKRPVNFNIGLAPELHIWVTSGQNRGILRVATGVEGVSLIINGKPYSRRTTNASGELRIHLDVNDYMVAVTREGYKELPPQRVKIEKGQESSLSFDMQPLPSKATLAMEGFPPETQVTLDKVPVGTISRDGTFRLSEVAPGDHEVGVSHPRYRPNRISKSFVAGKSIELGPGDLPLQPFSGSIDVSNLPLEDRRIATIPAPGSDAAKANKENWPKSAGWKYENPWYVVPVGQPQLFPHMPLNGTITFLVYRRAPALPPWSTAEVSWIANYIDSNNYVEFRIAGGNFRRVDHVRGTSKIFPSKLKVRSQAKGRDASYRVEITISANGITHRLQSGDHWETIDTWSEPGRDYSKGAFGFWLAGTKDELLVSGFNFEPAPLPNK